MVENSPKNKLVFFPAESAIFQSDSADEIVKRLRRSNSEYKGLYGKIKTDDLTLFIEASIELFNQDKKELSMDVLRTAAKEHGPQKIINECALIISYQLAKKDNELNIEIPYMHEVDETFYDYHMNQTAKGALPYLNGYNLAKGYYYKLIFKQK